MMREMPSTLPALAAALLLSACTVLPSGPSVMTLPGSGRSLESFRADDLFCRDYAFQWIGGKTASQAAQQSAVTSAAIGTAVGALAGAAIGGDSRAAGVGAGVGLLAGSAAGSEAASGSSMGTQRQYDNAYIQCMYSKGHRVPVPASMVTQQQPVRAAEAGIPPPPAGVPPAPPPR